MDYLFEGRVLKADPEGYLLDLHDWSEPFMEYLAGLMGLTLTPEHRTVINTVRRYYETYATTPAMRPLQALLKKDGHPELADSITLAALFPDGAAKSAARLAGLPKPVHCI